MLALIFKGPIPYSRSRLSNRFGSPISLTTDSDKVSSILCPATIHIVLVHSHRQFPHPIHATIRALYRANMRSSIWLAPPILSHQHPLGTHHTIQMAYWPSTPFAPYPAASYDEAAFSGPTFCRPREEYSTSEEYDLQNPMTAAAFGAGFEAGFHAALNQMVEEQQATNGGNHSMEAIQAEEAWAHQTSESKQTNETNATTAPKQMRRKSRAAFVDEHGWWPVGSGSARLRVRKEAHKPVAPPTFETGAEKEAKARAFLRARSISLPVETGDGLNESIRKALGAEEPLGFHMRLLLARAVVGDWLGKNTDERQAIYNRFRLAVGEVLEQASASVETKMIFRSRIFLSLHKKLTEIRANVKTESVVSLEIPEVPMLSDFSDVGSLSDIAHDLEDPVDMRSWKLSKRL